MSMPKTNAYRRHPRPCQRIGRGAARNDSRGMDVARINFSHASLETVPELVRLIRRLAAEAETTVGILGDLQGPRVRVGDMLGGEIELEPGRETVSTPEAVEGTPERIPVTYPELARRCRTRQHHSRGRRRDSASGDRYQREERSPLPHSDRRQADQPSRDQSSPDAG